VNPTVIGNLLCFGVSMISRPWLPRMLLSRRSGDWRAVLLTPLLFMAWSEFRPALGQVPGIMIGEYTNEDRDECRDCPSAKSLIANGNQGEGHGLEYPVPAGSGRWIVVAITHFRYFPDTSPDVFGGSIPGYRWSSEQLSRSRVIAIDLKSRSIRQLKCIPDNDGRRYDICGHFAWGDDSVGIYLKPAGPPIKSLERRFRADDETIQLLKWNLTTNLVTRQEPLFRIWQIAAVIDSERLRLDESQLANGVVRLVSRNTGDSVEVPVDVKQVMDPRLTPPSQFGEYFVRGATPTSVIKVGVTEGGEMVATSYEAELNPGPAWSISESALRDVLGGDSLYDVTPLKGQAGRTPHLALYVSGLDKRNRVTLRHLVIVDKSNGRIRQLRQFHDYKTIDGVPVISANGRWMGRFADRIIEGVEALRNWLEVSDLTPSEPEADPLEVERSWAVTVAITDEGAMILENTGGEKIVVIEYSANGWTERTLFELLPAKE
jgi:hypothetical protein